MGLQTCLRLIALAWILIAPAARAQDASVNGLHIRRTQLLQALEPRFFVDLVAKTAGYDAVGYAALHGCVPPQQMDRVLAKTTAKPVELFARTPLTRYLFQFDRCLTPPQRRQIVAALSDPSQLFLHGTLNHAVLSSTSYYLLAQRYPDITWTDRGGAPFTSDQVMARYKTLLMSRFRKFMADGFAEQLSSTYAMNNLYPLLLLVDFAQDPELRDSAAQLAAAQLALLRADSIDGALMPPADRENPPAQTSTNPPTNARDILWLYYGGFGPITGKRFEPSYATMLAASAWIPPYAVLALPRAGSQGHEIRIVTPGFSEWGKPTGTELVGGAWIDRDFAIGAGNGNVNPGEYADHIVMFRMLIRGMQPVGSIECYQPYFKGDEGEDAWDTDRSSPFMRSFRRGPQGVLLFDIPESDPYRYPLTNHFFAERAGSADHLNQLAECRLPRAADELDATQKGVFARYGSVFVAIKSLGSTPVEISRNPMGSNLKDYMTLKVRGGHAALYYRAAPAVPNQTLAAFKARVLQDAPAYDPVSDTVTLTALDGRSYNVSFNDLKVTAESGPAGMVAQSGGFTWQNSQISFSAAETEP